MTTDGARAIVCPLLRGGTMGRKEQKGGNKDRRSCGRMEEQKKKCTVLKILLFAVNLNKRGEEK